MEAKTKLSDQSFDDLKESNQKRAMIGSVLFAAAAFSLLGAIFLESFGLVSADYSPLSFVGAVVFLKLGFFSFWPVIFKKGREASVVMQGVMSTAASSDEWTNIKELLSKQKPKKSKMVLWDENDPRLDLSLFASNVPTFVVNHEQRFLDWNIAFELVFSEVEKVKRGAHISRWFDSLDNFKNVSKREQKLYGEGILPLADRERATFISPRFGRMVFTKIMTPVVDGETGKVVGWNIVLNINSVSKRRLFFDALYKSINDEVESLRYAASYDGIFTGYDPYRRLVQKHVESVAGAKRVFDLGAGTGNLSRILLSTGKRVTAVEKEIHSLRRLREKCGESERLRIVRQDPENLKKLPESKYDAAVLMDSLGRFADPLPVLRSLSQTLRDGATLSVSVRLSETDTKKRFNLLRDSLVSRKKFETLKHQFSHVLEYEEKNPHTTFSLSALRPLFLAAGFEIESETTGLMDGHTCLIVARKMNQS